MVPTRARVLIAAPALVIRQLSAVLPAEVEVISAATRKDAVQRLSENAAHLIIVCYIFDEMRPYGLIQHVRSIEPRRTPIILIRAVTTPWGATHESDVRRSYEDLGVDAFLNFSDIANSLGLDVALKEFSRVADALLAGALAVEPLARRS